MGIFACKEADAMSRSRPASILLAGLLAIGCSGSSATAAEAVFPANLAGHAILPAPTFLAPPADAPASLQTSGKTAPRPASGDVVPPFAGQPAQGHSAIRRAPDGSFWLVSDNGTGRKDNAADFMLHLSRYRVDFDSGSFDRLETVFLSDPQSRAPFPIVTAGTAERYLTGADFDPESLAFTADAIWIGDEFGPYLLKFDSRGRLLEVFDTLIDGRPARSPDHPDGSSSARVQRSKGLEALAASPDGTVLYPMLEGPLYEDAVSDARVVRILEFDVAGRHWTGRHWKYVLHKPSHAVGDVAMIDATTALVIERDLGFGTVDRACPAGPNHYDCFPDPAKFKRVYKIELDQRRVGDSVRKIGYVDLMSIADPRGRALKPLTNGVLAFPFVTIEGVDVVDDRHIVVGNDNNLPYSRSREPTRVDDNELVLVEVAELLNAR
ncbi:MAG: esterase-like activity of phytase family protein [Mycobacterium sp.]|nr:esterase-like activity of phytase family protein [Mycobacterium sp.]